MSDETKLARQQTVAAVGILQQPEIAEHCARREDRTIKPERTAPPERWKVLSIEAHRIGLSPDEPPAGLNQLGGCRGLGRDPRNDAA
jgi:hypothetical protein